MAVKIIIKNYNNEASVLELLDFSIVGRYFLGFFGNWEIIN